MTKTMHATCSNFSLFHFWENIFLSFAKPIKTPSSAIISTFTFQYATQRTEAQGTKLKLKKTECFSKE
jgi:hypothetical protein